MKIEKSEEQVIREVSMLIKDAVTQRASDMHFEIFGEKARIRLRIDGVLKTIKELESDEYKALCSRFKVMSNVNLNETRLPQDGRIQLSIDGKRVDLRISFVPCIYGENICIRILSSADICLDINMAGLSSVNLETLRKWYNSPNGIVVLTGPTGSGKTTLLYMVIHELTRETQNIYSVEDPVEYELEGVNQIPVNVGIGLTFSRALRALLRQDPDVIMLGEIRDRDVLLLAIESALTGHLVLSTLHTNNATDSLLRMKDIGAEPFLIKDTLKGIVAQRLVRRLCKECRTVYVPDDMTLKNLNLPKQEYYKACGCDKCNNTGYRGRIGIHELYAPSSTVMNMMLKGASSDEIRVQAISEGMRTLFDDGIDKAAQGITSIDEVVRVLPSESATVQ